jgi:hypothetical protein
MYIVLPVWGRGRLYIQGRQSWPVDVPNYAIPYSSGCKHVLVTACQTQNLYASGTTGRVSTLAIVSEGHDLSITLLVPTGQGQDGGLESESRCMCG